MFGVVAHGVDRQKMTQHKEVVGQVEPELPEAQSFPELSGQGSELIYKLYDKPPLLESIFVAIQHVLAAFVGIVTPPLIICSSLGLDAADTSYIISMSLFASGICTFIQCKTFGPVGSGLLSLQGTSFAFLGSILGVGLTAIEGGRSPQQALALIFGVCFFGAFANVILSRVLHLLSKIVTPIVSGTLVMLISQAWRWHDRLSRLPDRPLLWKPADFACRNPIAACPSRPKPAA